MTQTKTGFYKIAVLIAYAFYLLLGTTWLLTTLIKAHHFNFSALLIILVFGIQAYFKNRLANLIIGVLSLFFSFFMLLDVLNTFGMPIKNDDFGFGAGILLGMSILSIILSGILIFSFTKQNQDMEK